MLERKMEKMKKREIACARVESETTKNRNEPVTKGERSIVTTYLQNIA